MVSKAILIELKMSIEAPWSFPMTTTKWRKLKSTAQIAAYLQIVVFPEPRGRARANWPPWMTDSSMARIVSRWKVFDHSFGNMPGK